MVLQAAIAALLADAQTADETDWVQIVEWYDELVRLTDSPVVRLIAPSPSVRRTDRRAGLAALGELDPMLPQYPLRPPTSTSGPATSPRRRSSWLSASHGLSLKAEAP